MRTATIAIVCVCLIGCRGGELPAATQVKGQVFVKGQPAAGALVIFHPQEPERATARKSYATVGDDGSFELTTYVHGDGAPEGEYAVTIVWSQRVKEAPEAKEAKFALKTEGGGKAVDRLGGRYSDPKDPKLKKTIKKGEPSEFRFDLD